MKSTTWFCTWCRKPVNSLGVASHRAMHRRRHDGPVVFVTGTRRIIYDFRESDEA